MVAVRRIGPTAWTKVEALANSGEDEFENAQRLLMMKPKLKNEIQ